MNTIVNVTCADDGIVEINADMIFNDGTIHVCITDEAICFSQNCTMADVDAMLDRTIENPDDIEAYDWLDKHWDMFDRMDSIKYYQNFQGFKHLDNPYDVFLSDTGCIDVIEFVAALIDEHKLNPETYDDEGSWYYRMKQTAIYHGRMFLKELFCDRYRGFSTMSDGNIYRYVPHHPNASTDLIDKLIGIEADLVNITTGEVHKIIDIYSDSEDVCIYEVEK